MAKKPDDAAEETTATEVKKLPENIFSDEMPKEPILPLDDQVKEKPYAALTSEATDQTKANGKANGTADAGGNGQQPTDADNGGNGQQPTDADNGGQAAAPEGSQPLTDEEKRTAAALTVTMFFKAYDKVHGLARWGAKIDDTEVLSMHAQGKIDLNQEIPLGNGNDVSLGGFINNYNHNIDRTLIVSDEFKNDFRPPAERVCLKRGWLLNDELVLVALLAEDLSTKTGLFFAYKKSINAVLKAFIKQKSGDGKQTTTEQPHPNAKEESATDSGRWDKEPE